MIEIKHLSKTYGKKKTAFVALDDVSFSLEEGSSLAIVGKSGSGKSTLMHVMSGLDHPETGEVRIDGQDILKLKGRKLDRFRAQSIGFIFQSFFVEGNESCQDNVSLPLEIAKVARSKRSDRIRRALRAVELADKTGQKAKNLSGGQKQRLAIARAIVNQPKILFADEPTGNLDSATSDQIEKLMFDLNQQSGVTLVIVTHDEDLAAKCDKRIYIKDGRIDKTEGGQV